MKGNNVILNALLVGALCAGGVVGQFENCWLTSCTILKNLETSSADIIANQEELKNIVGNMTVSGSEQNILNAISTSETNVISEIQRAEQFLLALTDASKTEILSGVSNLTTTITDSVSASQSVITGEISSSETVVTGAISASETTLTNAISASQAAILSDSSMSEGVLTAAISNSELTVTGAISQSETNIASAITSSQNAVTGAISASESVITTAITSSQSAITSAITGSETVVTNAITTSEGNTATAISTAETNILDDISMLNDSLSDVKGSLTPGSPFATSISTAAAQQAVTDLTTVVEGDGVLTRNAISTSQGVVTSAITASEGNINAAIQTSEGMITGAISGAEMSINSAIGASQTAITDTIAASETVITDAIATAKNNITGEISAAEMTITNSVSSSETNILAAINTLSNDLVVLDGKIDQILAVVQPPSPPFIAPTDVTGFQIELDILSGVVNPSWAVNSGDGEFNNVLTVLSGATSTTLPSKVGYRGFLVSATVSGGTTVMYTFGQGQQSSTTLETTLLNTNNGALSSDVFNIALAGINGLAPPDIGTQGPLGGAQLGVDNPECGRNNVCLPPAFDPSQWTSTTDNSYNYATGIKTGTYAQPGRAGGAMYTDLTGSVVRGAAVLDVILDFEDPLAGAFPDASRNCLMALVMIPGVDFHFLRIDDTGTWSHKPGPRPPTDKDNSGNTITDPRTADIAPYKFARFLGVCPRKAMVI